MEDSYVKRVLARQLEVFRALNKREHVSDATLREATALEQPDFKWSASEAFSKAVSGKDGSMEPRSVDQGQLGELLKVQDRVRMQLLAKQARAAAEAGDVLTYGQPQLVDWSRFKRKTMVGYAPEPFSVIPVHPIKLVAQKRDEYQKREEKRKQDEIDRQIRLQQERSALEQRLRDEEEMRAKKVAVRRSYLKHLFAHFEKFRTFHKDRKQLAAARATKACNWLASRERRLRALEDKERRLRMKLLRENDMDKYRSMVADHTNTIACKV
jgi:hypothetical protein